MKNLMRLPAVLLGLLLLLTGTPQKAMAQDEDVSLQSFYDELSPYGTWIQDPEYGYVWRPDVDQDEFRPYYSNGRWAMTEYGNTWVSNYDWGWAPFHYGRWIYNRYNNWIWIPDTVWGPAWVSWRSGGGNYGWAPLGPQIGININIGRSYRVPDFCWNFVPYSNIYVNTFPRYYGRRNNVYIQNTVIINNTYVRNGRSYYTGPRADEIRRYTNRNVTVYNINRSNRAGNTTIVNNNINIYQPRASRSANNDGGRPAPRNAVAANVRTQVVSRDNTVSSRPSRGTENNGAVNRENGTVSNRPNRGVDNGGNADRTNGNISSRPTRGTDGSTPQNRDGRLSTTPNRGGSEAVTRQNTAGNEAQRAEQPQRSGRGGRGDYNLPQAQPRAEQPQKVESAPQQRVERPQVERQAPQQRMERPQVQQQAPAQRTERTQQAQPQRVERSSGGGEQRRGGSESSGRASRGGRG